MQRQRAVGFPGPSAGPPSRLQQPIAHLRPIPRQRRRQVFGPGSGWFLAAGLLALAAPSGASPLSEQVQTAARRCFASPAAASCAAVWNLSDALKKQADKRDLLRCNTSVLAVEAMVSMAQMGIQDPGHQQQALQAVTAECP